MGHPSPDNGEAGPGVSRRAVLLGLLGSLLIAAGEPFGVLVLRGSPMGADFSTGAAIFLFLPLTLVLNPLVRLLGLPALRRGELVTIYIMMIVAAAIPSWGFTLNLIPLIGGFFYYATPENEWAQLIQPHIPMWLVPESRIDVWKLFEGGARGEPVSWSSWGPPLLIWSLFAVTIYFVTLCLLVILRKQWVEREKLLFPMAVLPLEMGTGEPGRILPPFFRSYVMWAGFLIPFLVNSLEALHRYYNFIPVIDMDASIPILRNSIYLRCSPRLEVIGLSYLLSLDVGFGVWFFAFLALLQTGLERMLGWNIGPVQPFSDPASPSVAHLAQGALLFLVFAGFWHGRRHLRDVLRKAFGDAPDVDDSSELFSYRTAVFGSLLGSLLALVWLLAAGLNLPTAFVFLTMSMVIFIGLTRIIAQTVPGLGGVPHLHGQCPRKFDGGSHGADGSGTELRLGGGRSHLRDGVRGDRREAGTGDGAGGSAPVLGYHGRHPRHPRRLRLGNRRTVLSVRRHQPGGLAVQRTASLHWQLDHAEPQQPAADPALAHGLPGPGRRPHGRHVLRQEPLRRLSHPPHRHDPRHDGADVPPLVLGVHRLDAEGRHSQVRRSPRLFSAAPLLPRHDPGGLRLGRVLADRRLLHRHDGQQLHRLLIDRRAL